MLTVEGQGIASEASTEDWLLTMGVASQQDDAEWESLLVWCVRLGVASLEAETNESSSSMASLIVLSIEEIPIVVGIELIVADEDDAAVIVTAESTA